MGRNLQKNTGSLPDVLILCGGQGVRFRSVATNEPKSLAIIGRKAFLDILLGRIFDQGFNRVILAVGHLKEKIIKRYRDDPRISFSIEEKPRGTGGAVINALDMVSTEYFIVMNGDSYCRVDLQALFNEHLKRKPLISLVLSQSKDVSDLGNVMVDENGRVLAFIEKTMERKPGLANAGVYVFGKNISGYAPTKENFSLEEDLFPMVVKEFCYGHVISDDFLDIGTPERYDIAKQRLIDGNI